MNSITISKIHPFSYRLVVGLMVLLTLENPEVATSQGHPGQSQSPDPPSTTKAAPPTSSSTTEAEGDIFQILKEEKESISRGLGQEQPISEAPANVYVITDEDIRHSGATDIPTVLRRIPGMEVMQMTSADFNVSTRGNNQTTANHMLVLIDGRSIYEDTFATVFWTIFPITLPEIKRIEVWKGPASQIYGFNAFDGVINIVTKSPEEMKANSALGTTLQIGGGELGTIRSAAIQAGMHGNFGYRLSFGHDQSQKWQNRDALGLRVNKFNLRTEYNFSSDSKLVFTGGLADSNRFDGQVFDVVRESSTILNGFTNLEYRKGNFFIRGNWMRWDEARQELFDPRIAPFSSFTDRAGNTTAGLKQNVYNLEAQHATAITSSNIATYGFNFRHNAVSLNTLDQFRQENRLGFYLQDEWSILKHLTLTAGVRWDLHTELNPTYSPRFAAVYRPTENHSFRLSFAIGHRAPTILEAYTDQRTQIFPFGIVINSIGSRNLSPERIMSYEAGYQGWFLKHRIRVRGDVFYNHISDFIIGASLSPTTSTLTNAGKADLWGAEIGGEFFITSWLTMFANYSFVNLWQSQDIGTSSFARGAPSYKVNAGLRTELESGLSGEILVHHVADTSYPISGAFPFFFNFTSGGFIPPDPRVGSYTLLNMRAGYLFWKDRAEVAVSVFNALNDLHRENPVGEIFGSRVIGWLTLRY